MNVFNSLGNLQKNHRMNIYSTQQLYEADRITCEKQQISSLDLMERAATQIFNWLDQRMQGAQVPIHIFCGIGNNGGDGLVLGRLLLQAGYHVNVYIANFTDKRSKCFLKNYDRIKNVNKRWPKLMTSESDFPLIHPDDIIVDALFGIGLNRPPEGWVKLLIQYLNAQKAFKLSIDIPSGLPANQPVPDPEAVIQANHTLTFQAPKLAFFLPESGHYVPYFEPLNIGLDPEYLASIQPLGTLLLKEMVRPMYRQRSKFSHKGSYGHVGLYGGSYGKMGAMILASKAALNTGAGLATACVPKAGMTPIQAAAPEVMAIESGADQHLQTVPEQFDPSIWVAGMGMGMQDESVAALSALLKKAEGPMVLDADALNILAANKKMIDSVPKGSVLTPHPGELERLLGSWENDYQKIDLCKAFCSEKELILVVKGAHSLVTDGTHLFINSTGNPGMATAGSGDVLSGVIGGLMAQGYNPMEAAIFGVYLHGSSGNLAVQHTGFEALVASDLIEYLGPAFLELFQKPEPQQQEEQEEA